MAQNQRLPSVRRTVTYSTSFGIPQRSASTYRTEDRQSRPSDHDVAGRYNPATGISSTSFGVAPTFTSAYRTSDRQSRPSNHDAARSYGDSDRQSRPSHHDAARSYGDSGRQSRPSREDATRSSGEPATSLPEWPAEAVKLFLAVMWEGIECQHSQFQRRQNATEHLAQDLESHYGLRTTADVLLRKYDTLRAMDPDMLRDLRAGSDEHASIMNGHRQRVAQRLEEKQQREERNKNRERVRPRETERERLREREIQREEERQGEIQRERGIWASMRHRSEERDSRPSTRRR